MTTPLSLILDVRETRLAEALTGLKVPYTTANLDVGDFLIQNAEGEPLLVAERKSHADFAASNTDGRYREQRARLMAVRGSGVAVLYILEGIWSETEGRRYGSLTEANLKRLTTRLILRYGMPVLAGDSLMDTARWCRTLLAQLTDDPTVFQPESAAAAADAMSGFTAAISTVKKGNKTAGGTAAAMLSAIPGLGGKRVAGLLELKSIAELVSLSAAELAELSVGGKRVGPALGKTIAEALQFKQ
jgi:ERCC4-type nuclease